MEDILYDAEGTRPYGDEYDMIMIYVHHHFRMYSP